MSEVDVRIRRAERLEDIRACMDLQREVWGFTEPEDRAAPPLLVVANRYGGCVLLAERSSGEAVGFSYALLSRAKDRSLFWWSHMTAVSSAYQGKSVGFQLKLGQRHAALKAGIRRILWTFDPLQALNAHFNVRKLGTISRVYEDNLYGQSSSPLHHGIPTDRLLAEWDLEAPRVTDRLSGNAPVILRDFDGMVRIVETDGIRPNTPRLGLEVTPLVLEIPTNINVVRETHPGFVLEWQKTVGQACHHYFDRGYAVTDFVILERPRAQALYLLEKSQQ